MSNDDLLFSLFMSISSIIFVIPFWKILPKAGYNKVFALLMFIPGFTIIMLYFLAFTKWPRNNEKKLE